MKKKIFLMLPCIAAVAIATFVGKKTFESHAFGSNGLLVTNVEALASGENKPQKQEKCYDSIHAKDGCQVRYCPICDFISGTDDLTCIADKCPK